MEVMKKRGVIHNRSHHRSTRRAVSSARTTGRIHPGVAFGVIIAVVVLMSVANWLYKTGAFAAVPEEPTALATRVYDDTKNLVTAIDEQFEENNDSYQQVLDETIAMYEAEIDDLNAKIEQAIEQDDIKVLVDDVSSDEANQAASQSTGGAVVGTRSSGFWARVGAFFGNLFN